MGTPEVSTFADTSDDAELRAALRVIAGLKGHVKALEAEVKRLRAVVTELQDQRGRLEQIEEDYVPGLPERRLADDLLDALTTYETADAAGGGVMETCEALVCETCGNAFCDGTFPAPCPYCELQQLRTDLAKLADHPAIMQESGTSDVDRCLRVLNRQQATIRGLEAELARLRTEATPRR